jgi:hypothetical protein
MAALPVFFKGSDDDDAVAAEPFVVPPATIAREEVVAALSGYVPISNSTPPRVTFDPPRDITNVRDFPFYRVRIRSDGSLRGRVVVLRAGTAVRPPAGNMNIIIYRAREVVYRGTTNGDGTFAAINFAPGIYNVLAAGPAGMAVFQFEAIQNNVQAQRLTGEDATRTVAHRKQPPMQGAGASDTLLIPLVPVELVPKVLEAIQGPMQPIGEEVVGEEVPLAGTGPMGGFGGYGGGFGSGGGGGGGNLGNLPGLAPIALIAPLLNDDNNGGDNGFNVGPSVPPPSSPNSP